MTKKRVTLVFLIAITALSLALCLIIFRPFIMPLLTAAVIAIVFFPVHARVVRWVRSPSVAAFVSTLLVVLIVVVPAVAIGIAITREATDLYHQLGERSDESGGWNPYLTELLQKPLDWISRYIDVSQIDPRGWLLGRMKEVGSLLLSEVGIVVGNITSFLINAVITLFTLFFVFREGRSIRRRVAAVLPLNPDQVERLFNQINNTIIATVNGGLVVAAAQGTLTGLAFAVLGIRSPVLWGVVAAFFSLLPLFGSAIVWAPAALFLIASGHWVQGLLLIGWGAGVVGTIDNVLRPLIMSGRVRMHTLLIFFSVFGGVRVFGFMGLFMGPVILAITISLLSMLRDEARTWQTQWRGGAADTEADSSI
jgi:predicted PurR-regulated permease PerM